MSKAEAIKTLCGANNAWAQEIANRIAVAQDNNWTAESTDYILDDNSVIRFSGPDYWPVQG